MGIDLYYKSASPPCRSVMMLAKALDIEFNMILTDILKGEQMTDAFLAINPTHTIPVIRDGDLVLWESRAILIYLAEKYGDSSLYPVELEKRAEVNKLLFFDLSILFQRFRDYITPVLWMQEEPNEELREKITEALGWFNMFLEGREWAAGDNLTIADFSLVSTFSTIDIIGVETSGFDNIQRWFEKCQNEMPGYDINVEGLEEFRAILK